MSVTPRIRPPGLCFCCSHTGGTTIDGCSRNGVDSLPLQHQPYIYCTFHWSLGGGVDLLAGTRLVFLESSFAHHPTSFYILPNKAGLDNHGTSVVTYLIGCRSAPSTLRCVLTFIDYPAKIQQQCCL